MIIANYEFLCDPGSCSQDLEDLDIFFPEAQTELDNSVSTIASDSDDFDKEEKEVEAPKRQRKNVANNNKQLYVYARLIQVIVHFHLIWRRDTGLIGIFEDREGKDNYITPKGKDSSSWINGTWGVGVDK